MTRLAYTIAIDTAIILSILFAAYILVQTIKNPPLHCVTVEPGPGLSAMYCKTSLQSYYSRCYYMNKTIRCGQNDIPENAIFDYVAIPIQSNTVNRTILTSGVRVPMPYNTTNQIQQSNANSNGRI